MRGDCCKNCFLEFCGLLGGVPFALSAMWLKLRVMESVCSLSARRLWIAAGLFFGALVPSHAAILANYNFTSATASVDADANSTASSFTSNYGSNSGLSGAGNYFVRVQVTPPLTDPVTTTNYFTFTVTAASGFTLNLTDLALKTALVDPNQPSGTTFVRSSVDGFAFDLGSYTQTGTSGSDFTNRSIDLTGAAYQNLSSITFRIYHYDDTDSTSSTGLVHRIDDVVLNGSAIPEPASLAILGLGGLSMLVRRRR